MNALDDIRIRTGADDITEEEAASVLAWCREWASDAFGSDYSDDEATYTAAYILRQCDRHIDGGLRFVLADVRATAGASSFVKPKPELRTFSDLLTAVRNDADGDVYAVAPEMTTEELVAVLADANTRHKPGTNGRRHYAPIIGALRREIHGRAQSRDCYDCGASAGKPCKPDYGCTDTERALGHSLPRVPAKPRKPLLEDLHEQGLTAEDLARPDVLADTLAAGWTEEEVRELHPAKTKNVNGGTFLTISLYDFATLEHVIGAMDTDGLETLRISRREGVIHLAIDHPANGSGVSCSLVDWALNQAATQD